MPAYNAAPYIGETLDSVFAQTFIDYEVIVVNDGAPDTLELERALVPYKSRIRYIKQENLGAGAARNEGLRAAQGEFIAFLDADDLWLPNYLEEQLKFIRANDFDLVCADAMHFGDSPLAGRTYMEAFMETAPVEGELTHFAIPRISIFGCAWCGMARGWLIGSKCCCVTGARRTACQVTKSTGPRDNCVSMTKLKAHSISHPRNARQY